MALQRCMGPFSEEGGVGSPLPMAIYLKGLGNCKCMW